MQVKKGEKLIARLNRRLERLDGQNAKTKNRAGLRFVREVLAGGIEATELQLAGMNQEAAVYENALDVVEHLKCSGESLFEAYSEAMQHKQRQQVPNFWRDKHG